MSASFVFVPLSQACNILNILSALINVCCVSRCEFSAHTCYLCANFSTFCVLSGRAVCEIYIYARTYGAALVLKFASAAS